MQTGTKIEKKSQINANRRNAKKSTGPRTEAGKSVSRLNAAKHGLTSKRVIIPGEDGAEFDTLRNELSRELEPVGRQETDLVETIAMDIWRKRRIYRMEADIMNYEQAEKELELANRELRQLDGWYDDLDAGLVVAQDEVGEDDVKKKLAEAEVEKVTTKLRGLEMSLGTFLLSDPKYTDALEKLLRYEAAIDRSLSRARDQFARLQQDREERAATKAIVVNTMDPTDVESSGV